MVVPGRPKLQQLAAPLWVPSDEKEWEGVGVHGQWQNMTDPLFGEDAEVVVYMEHSWWRPWGRVELEGGEVLQVKCPYGEEYFEPDYRPYEVLQDGGRGGGGVRDGEEGGGIGGGGEEDEWGLCEWEDAGEEVGKEAKAPSAHSKSAAGPRGAH